MIDGGDHLPRQKDFNGKEVEEKQLLVLTFVWPATHDGDMGVLLEKLVGISDLWRLFGMEEKLRKGKMDDLMGYLNLGLLHLKTIVNGQEQIHISGGNSM